MTPKEKAVKDICDEVYKKFPEQILIDFIQDEVEDVLNKLDDNSANIKPSRDEVGALAYEADILLEVYNPKFEKDIDILKRLEKALLDWSKDIEQTNIILGIPREQ